MANNSTSSSDQYEVSNARVLIVDDSRIIRVALKKILKDEFVVDEAEDGAVALRKLGNELQYDLIITDLEMPNLNGFALIERLRHHHDQDFRHVPILIITSDELNDINKKALEEGATDYIIKPFKSEDVLKSIYALLRFSEQHKQEHLDAGTIDQDGHVDRLTGLGNLSHFHLRGTQELAFAKRHNKKLAVALIHFDGFKIHQKHLGAKLAYQLIRQTGKFIVDSARTEDTVARIREDRFGVILSMCNLLEAKAMVDRLMKRVHETTFRIGDKTIDFTVSIGVCSPNITQFDDFKRVFEHAEMMLEQAISRGGDTIVLGEGGKAAHLHVDSLEAAMNLSVNNLALLVKEAPHNIEHYLPAILEKLIPVVALSGKHHRLATEGFIEKIRTQLKQQGEKE